MRPLFCALAGLLVGLIVGIAGPVLLSLYLAWRSGFAPSGGAGTFFSILLIFTAPAGALPGFVVGYLYGYYE